MPGESIHSLRTLSYELKQTLKEIRTAIKVLEKGEIVAQRRAHGISVFCLVKWDKFQSSEKEGHSVGHDKGTLGAQEQEGNNGNTQKNKEYSPEFEAFWTAYPYKVGKPKAYKAYKKVIDSKQATHALLLTGVERYKLNLAAQRKAEGWAPQFKMPESWLNAARWDDPVYKSAKEQSTVRRGDNGVILPSGI